MTLLLLEQAAEEIWSHEEKQKIEMCILPGKGLSLGKKSIVLQVNVINCKPNQRCLPVGSEDTSNLGGTGLG